jgi:hypothetical protein
MPCFLLHLDDHRHRRALCGQGGDRCRHDIEQFLVCRLGEHPRLSCHMVVHQPGWDTQRKRSRRPGIDLHARRQIKPWLDLGRQLVAQEHHPAAVKRAGCKPARIV